MNSLEMLIRLLRVIDSVTKIYKKNSIQVIRYLDKSLDSWRSKYAQQIVSYKLTFDLPYRALAQTLMQQVFAINTLRVEFVYLHSWLH